MIVIYPVASNFLINAQPDDHSDEYNVNYLVGYERDRVSKDISEVGHYDLDPSKN
jgi:hypothetical protein